MSWSIRNYNAFLRGIKREFGITHKQAQSTYRTMSTRLDRRLTGADVRKHPRIAKQESVRAEGIKAIKPTKGIRTIAEWNRARRKTRRVHDFVERVAAGVDTGRKKKGK